MKKIVLDLEFTDIPRKNILPGFRKKEIIQIGAARLDEKDEFIDSFEVLVKPQFGPISGRIEKLTNITNVDVEDKLGFEEAIESFLAWIGDEECTIYSWSMEDYFQISGEAKLKDYQNEELERLYDNWQDLQEMVGEKLGLTKQLRLRDVLDGCGFTFKGQQHSALDDSVNTARILQLMNDEVAFLDTFKSIIEIFKPTEEKSYPFAKILDDLGLVPVVA